MEDRTEREIALYDLLKQVLCNYIVRQRITYHQALAACVPVLGFQLWLMRETQDEVPPLIEHAVEHHLSVAATWRTFLPLFAEVLAMARVDAGGHQWDIDGFIDGLREQLPPWIDYWESWAGQGHASGQEEAR
jgi:hypothetical protein